MVSLHTFIANPAPKTQATNLQVIRSYQRHTTYDEYVSTKYVPPNFYTLKVTHFFLRMTDTPLPHFGVLVNHMSENVLLPLKPLGMNIPLCHVGCQAHRASFS